jgi:hypothetical protein
MRRAVALTAVVVVTALVGACRSSLRPGEARLRVGEGAEILVGGGEKAPRAAHDGRMLRRGDRLKVVAGAAALELAGNRRLELRGGSEIELGADPVLVAGDALAVAPERLAVRSGGSLFTVEGAARLTRDLAVSAASYRGQVGVESAGRRLALPALRQASIASLGLVPVEPEPLRYRVEDTWDRRFLGPAMEAGKALEARSRGFTASLAPGTVRSPGFLRSLVPALTAEASLDALLQAESRPPGETLVGALIVTRAREAPFAQRWTAVFSFRQHGASWGLVAMDQGIADVERLVGALDAAIGRAPLDFAAPPVTGPSRPAGPAPSSPTDVRASPGTTRAGPGPTPGPNSPAPQQPPRLSTPGTPADPVVQPLVDVIEGLLPQDRR